MFSSRRRNKVVDIGALRLLGLHGSPPAAGRGGRESYSLKAANYGSQIARFSTPERGFLAIPITPPPSACPATSVTWADSHGRRDILRPAAIKCPGELLRLLSEAVRPGTLAVMRQEARETQKRADQNERPPNMKKQVLFVQGAGQGAHEEDAKLAASLGKELGPGYEVRTQQCQTRTPLMTLLGARAWQRNLRRWVTASSWLATRQGPQPD
jgi:hypothetical protein